MSDHKTSPMDDIRLAFTTTHADLVHAVQQLAAARPERSGSAQAKSLMSDLHAFGTLSDRQLGLARLLIDRDKQETKGQVRGV